MSIMSFDSLRLDSLAVYVMFSQHKIHSYSAYMTKKTLKEDTKRCLCDVFKKTMSVFRSNLTWCHSVTQV